MVVVLGGGGGCGGGCGGGGVKSLSCKTQSLDRLG